LTSIFTVTREDLYDYARCPKIVAIKAHRAIQAPHETRPQQPRLVEPTTIGKIGEAAVKLSLQGMPAREAMRRIAHSVPEIERSDYLEEIASESLRGMEEIRKNLESQYAKVTIIGRGEGRHPDLAGTARPDFIAMTEQSGTPIIIEAKDSVKTSPSYKFQAMFYNGIAEQFGIYLLEERLERESPKFTPQLLRSRGETVLVYPRLAHFSIVKEKYTPTEETIKEVWKAKELGFKGQVPETNCKKKCAHNRLKAELPEGNMEPLPPLPLIFSHGILENGHDLDLDYQTNYAWRLLPSRIKLAILLSNRKIGERSQALAKWLMNTLSITSEAADIVLDQNKREMFLRAKPDADTLLREMQSELEPWEEILKKRLVFSASSILARATAVYSLPRGSSKFVKDAVNRWS
jgi:CRISPR/Cas system-associated exonuclease Cas4 (RecB family)